MKNKRTPKKWGYHYYRMHEHIRSLHATNFWKRIPTIPFKLKKNPKKSNPIIYKPKQEKIEWRIKPTFNKRNVAFITIHTSTADDWYFNSGCSRHMTGNRAFFSKLKECTSGHMTFGDGARGKILVKGNILKPNLPNLLELRLVEGANFVIKTILWIFSKKNV